MKHRIRMRIGYAALAASITLPIAAGAQQRGPLASPRPTTYDPRRETLLEGTVLVYTADSPRPPIGAHVTVQTASGTVNVHLGLDSYLRSNHFSLAAGDFVRFVGVNITTSQGDVFLARTAQKGDESIALRSSSGFLRATAFARTLPQGQHNQTTEKGNPR